MQVELHTMCSEFNLKALLIESKLWSFRITIQFWNIHQIYKLSEHTICCKNEIQSQQISMSMMTTHTPDSSAAHLSVSAYLNSRSGDSDSPWTQHTHRMSSNATDIKLQWSITLFEEATSMNCFSSYLKKSLGIQFILLRLRIGKLLTLFRGNC